MDSEHSDAKGTDCQETDKPSDSPSLSPLQRNEIALADHRLVLPRDVFQSDAPAEPTVNKESSTPEPADRNFPCEDMNARNYVQLMGHELAEARPFLEQHWDNWKEQQKLKVLQEITDHAADLRSQFSDALDIMPPHISDEGMFIAKGDETLARGMYVKPEHLNDLARSVELSLHEAGHSYQKEATTENTLEPDNSKVSAWNKNMKPGNYIKPDEGMGYYYQPIERDTNAISRAIREISFGAQEKSTMKEGDIIRSQIAKERFGDLMEKGPERPAWANEDYYRRDTLLTRLEKQSDYFKLSGYES